MDSLVIVNCVFGDPHGGRWKVVQDYNRHLKALGHEVICFTNPGAENEVEGVNYLSQKVSGHYDILAAWKIRKELKRRGVRLAFCHCGRSLATMKLATFGLNIPLIGISHSTNVKRLARANWSIAISSEIIGLYQKFGQKGDRIFHLPNAVDTTHLCPPRTQFLNHPPVLGIAARMVKDKGWFDLIDAFELVRNEHKIDCKLLLVGDGEEKENIIQTLTEKKLIEFCQIEGWQKNLDDFYRKIDISVVPSWREAFGMSLLESFQMGVPVISNDLAPCKEILDQGKAGSIFQVKNPKELAEVITKSIEEPNILWTKAQFAQKHLCQYYGWSAVREKLKKLISYSLE